MLMKGRLWETIQGLRQEVRGGWRGSVEEISNTCKKDIRPNLILTKDPRKGNKLSYISEGSYRSNRELEMENLRKQVKELEIYLRGQHYRRNREGSSKGPRIARKGGAFEGICSWTRRGKYRPRVRKPR